MRISSHANEEVHREENKQKPGLFVIGVAEQKHDENTLQQELFHPRQVVLDDVSDTVVEEREGACKNERQEHIKVREHWQSAVQFGPFQENVVLDSYTLTCMKLYSTRVNYPLQRNARQTDDASMRQLGYYTFTSLICF